MPDLQLPSRGEVDAEVSRRRLLPFIKRLFPGFEEGPHHALLASYMEAVERGDITRLVVETPPRHTKSTIVSVFFPAWFIGRKPTRKVIDASYSADLPFGFSRQARGLLKDPLWPFPACRLNEEAQGVRHWTTTVEGAYHPAGVGGGITGQGADLLVIDDPVKGHAEADSALMRDAAEDWYYTDARTRLQPSGRVVLTMTRWHEDDLAGRLLAKAKRDPTSDQWVVLRLPAIAEEPSEEHGADPLGRMPGEALWPAWYPIEELLKTKETMPPRWWDAMYQQRPTSTDGGSFRAGWFDQWYEYGTLPLYHRVFAVDSAWETGPSNDFSAITVASKGPGGYYFEEALKRRVEYPDLKDLVVSMYARLRPSAVLVENSASGKAIIQELRRSTMIPVIGVEPQGTKQIRAEAESPLWQSGRVFLPKVNGKPAPWVGEFTREHLAFPTGVHDDYVDASTMCLHYLARGDIAVTEVLRRQAQEERGVAELLKALGRSQALGVKGRRHELPGVVGSSRRAG